MKFKVLILSLLVFLLAACSPTKIEDIQFYLNPGVDTISEGTSYQDPGATAKFNLNFFDVVVVDNTVDVQTPGEYYILYELRYEGDTRELKRIVTVIEARNDSIVLNPGIDTLNVGETWTDAGITLNPSTGFTITTTGEVDPSTPGEYRIQYLAVHEDGTRLSITRVVTVVE